MKIIEKIFVVTIACMLSLIFSGFDNIPPPTPQKREAPSSHTKNITRYKDGQMSTIKHVKLGVGSLKLMKSSGVRGFLCDLVYSQCIKEASPMPKELGSWEKVGGSADKEVANKCISKKPQCGPLCEKHASTIIHWKFENEQLLNLTFGCTFDPSVIDLLSCEETELPYEAWIKFDNIEPLTVHACLLGGVFTVGYVGENMVEPLKASLDSSGNLDCLGVKSGEEGEIENGKALCSLDITMEDVDGDGKTVKSITFHACPIYIKNTGKACYLKFIFEAPK